MVILSWLWSYPTRGRILPRSLVSLTQNTACPSYRHCLRAICSVSGLWWTNSTPYMLSDTKTRKEFFFFVKKEQDMKQLKGVPRFSRVKVQSNECTAPPKGNKWEIRSNGSKAKANEWIKHMQTNVSNILHLKACKGQIKWIRDPIKQSGGAPQTEWQRGCIKRMRRPNPTDKRGRQIKQTWGPRKQLCY